MFRRRRLPIAGTRSDLVSPFPISFYRTGRSGFELLGLIHRIGVFFGVRRSIVGRLTARKHETLARLGEVTRLFPAQGNRIQNTKGVTLDLYGCYNMLNSRLPSLDLVFKAHRVSACSLGASDITYSTFHALRAISASPSSSTDRSARKGCFDRSIEFRSSPETKIGAYQVVEPEG